MHLPLYDNIMYYCLTEDSNGGAEQVVTQSGPVAVVINPPEGEILLYATTTCPFGSYSTTTISVDGNSTTTPVSLDSVADLTFIFAVIFAGMYFLVRKLV